jgi:hypothetical protein
MNIRSVSLVPVLSLFLVFSTLSFGFDKNEFLQKLYNFDMRYKYVIVLGNTDIVLTKIEDNNTVGYYNCRGGKCTVYIDERIDDEDIELTAVYLLTLLYQELTGNYMNYQTTKLICEGIAETIGYRCYKAVLGYINLPRRVDATIQEFKYAKYVLKLPNDKLVEKFDAYYVYGNNKNDSNKRVVDIIDTVAKQLVVAKYIGDYEVIDKISDALESNIFVFKLLTGCSSSR